MDFKLDENLPQEMVSLLKQQGHDATTIIDEQLGGADDKTVFAACVRERRVLSTLDTDFADIREYGHHFSPGIIVLRLRKQSKNHILSVSKRMLPLFEMEDVNGDLWIVDENRVRIRQRE